MRKSPAKSKIPEKKTDKPSQIVVTDSPEVAKIQQIKDNFRKTIQTPIQFIQSVENSKSPQRCIVHNTILTLYCEIDRKPLCANCMYQQDTHRKHRVIPLGRAMNLVRQDITSFQIKLEGNLSQCSSVSKKLHQTIIRTQRYYPSVIQRLKQYYSGMVKMLKQKEKQQISQILQLQQKMKNQIFLLDQQVKKIVGFINCKLKPINKPETQDLLMARRDVLEVLTKVNKIINHDIMNIFPDEQNGKIIDFSLYADVYEMVDHKLVIVLPGISVRPRNHRLHSSTSTHNMPNNIKIENQNHKSKSPRKNRTVSSKKLKKQVTFKFQ